MRLQDNVVSLFLEREAQLGSKTCFEFKVKGKWKTASWTEVKNQISSLMQALKDLGLKSGDRVAILSNTRYEWSIIDMASLALGAITVPIYQSTMAKDVAYLLNHSEAKILFIENKNQLKKIKEIESELKSLKTVVLIEKGVSDDLPHFHSLIKEHNPNIKNLEESAKKVVLDQAATIVYTSGTTGQPKGVLLTHRALTSEVDALSDVFKFEAQEKSLLFLPLAHILARALQFFQLSQGFIQAYAESIDKLLDDLQEVKPHFILSVPRIFEKIHSKILHDLENGNLLKKTFKKFVFSCAVDVGRKTLLAKQKNQTLGLVNHLQNTFFNDLVFSKLKNKLGGNLKLCISGGAPLSAEIGEFFNIAGLLILEGYGLTETTAGVCCNLPHRYKFGTVGPVVRNAEVKIADDGEILAKGHHVFKEYYKDPKATAEAFTEDGFFKTGDIGEFDQEGFLRITDRKKDIIVTAAGKNVAPQFIENLLKMDPLISQVMVHGDKRKFLSALITLNPEELLKLAKELLIEGGAEEVAKHPKIFEIVRKKMEQKNKELPSYETIKRFAILPKDFTVEGGELTPTLKVKRKIVSERYKEILDSFYKE